MDVPAYGLLHKDGALNASGNWRIDTAGEGTPNHEEMMDILEDTVWQNQPDILCIACHLKGIA